MTISTHDIMWAAGFLEGEGSFTTSKKDNGRWKTPRVTASQVQLWPLERMQTLFGGSIYPVVSTNPQHKPQYHWQLNGSRAIPFMMTIYSLMSPGRKLQIECCLNVWKAFTRWKMADGYKVCRNGHEMTLENTYTQIRGEWKGRICKTCRREYDKLKMRRYRAARKARDAEVLGT